MTLTTIILWLYTIDLGIAFGAGIYEARVVVSWWANRIPSGFFEIESGRRFWGFVTTVPLTFLCLGSLFLAYGNASSARTPWLVSSIIVVAERILTFGYFIPTILRIQKNTEPASSQKNFALWQKVNWVRNGMTLIAWIAAMKALIVAGG